MYASAEIKKSATKHFSPSNKKSWLGLLFTFFHLISSILLIVEYGEDGLWGLHAYVQEESPAFFHVAEFTFAEENNGN